MTSKNALTIVEYLRTVRPPLLSSEAQKDLEPVGINERTLRRVLKTLSAQHYIRLEKVGRGTGKGVGNVIMRIDYGALKTYGERRKLAYD
jgi:hypothetical protein